MSVAPTKMQYLLSTLLCDKWNGAASAVGSMNSEQFAKTLVDDGAKESVVRHIN
jgi:hypothetical protein